MQKFKPYQTYFGGKSGNGTYQTIINNIPPHKVKISLFAGNCAVSRYLKPALYNYVNDIDSNVIEAWKACDLPPDFTILNRDAFEILKDMRNHPTGWAAGYVDKPFVFLDPPYLIDTRKSKVPVYKYELDQYQHQNLLSAISFPEMSRYNIMICCYPNSLYDLWLYNWRHVDFYSTIRGGVALERIYMNYPDSGLLHDYRYLGTNFTQRQQFKRIKENLIKKLDRLPLTLRMALINEVSDYLKTLNNEKSEQ